MKILDKLEILADATSPNWEPDLTFERSDDPPWSIWSSSGANLSYPEECSILADIYHENDADFLVAVNPQTIKAINAWVKKLELAANNLCKKLDIVEQSSEFRGMLGLAAAHDLPYNGPTITSELEDLREALVSDLPDISDLNPQQKVIT